MNLEREARAARRFVSLPRFVYWLPTQRAQKSTPDTGLKYTGFRCVKYVGVSAVAGREPAQSLRTRPSVASIRKLARLNEAAVVGLIVHHNRKAIGRHAKLEPPDEIAA
jgi:hypothetical protein